MKNKLILTSALLMSLPQLALAHAGDHSKESFFHLFTDPYHAAAIVGLVAIGGYFLARRKKEEVSAKQFKNKKQNT